MYHPIEDQEKNPNTYVLTPIDPSVTEDECHDLLTKPRQTQRTIGFYLKKIQDSKKKDDKKDNEDEEGGKEEKPREKKRFTLTEGSHSLEREVKRNKGLWVGRPQKWAHLAYKLRDQYTVDIPQKSRKGQGVFYRPSYMELDHHIRLANAGLLYSDEEFSDSEDEGQPDTTACIPLRKIRYKMCDPCKPQKDKKEPVKAPPPKDLIDEMLRNGEKPKFHKIPTGCQCDFYGEHNKRSTVWDNPFRDRVDMLRQHEMNKYLKPFKREILNKNYEENPPVKFMSREPGMKRTFPIYLISNL